MGIDKGRTQKTILSSSTTLSSLFWADYEQDELRVAEAITSQSNQGTQGISLVCPKPQED